MIHLATREEPLPMKVLERSLFDGAQSAKTLENFFFWMQINTSRL